MNTLTPLAPSVATESQSWPLDQLVDYIIEHYHIGALQQVIELQRMVENCILLYGDRYPKLPALANTLFASYQDLAGHFDKEEEVLFPYLKEMQQSVSAGRSPQEFHCGSVQFPISAMMSDHDGELDRYTRLLSEHEDASAPAEYQQMMQAIRDFIIQLQEHIYLENNNLFPRSIEMEEKYQTY